MYRGQKPVAHFDFDGTATEKADTLIRKIRKYPLEARTGFRDFVSGVCEANVELGHIISKRFDGVLDWRRRATMRSLVDIGMLDYFGSPSKVELAGSIFTPYQNEAKKARLVVASSRNRVTGMVEDTPEEFGYEAVRASIEEARNGVVLNQLVIGVVDSDDPSGRIDQLANKVDDTLGSDAFVSNIDDGLRVVGIGGAFMIDVVRTGAYTRDNGIAFGERLVLAAG